jgi:hypothetical protein
VPIPLGSEVPPPSESAELSVPPPSIAGRELSPVLESEPASVVVSVDDEHAANTKAIAARRAT